ncbi:MULTISPECIES: outer membrane lipoprotein carrier protein LolA [unclassified Gilliamella]|uniref:outer membrane lipoprotein carrier protein LolA n=1 Tax=unclassified Gilliamella TaxID=2685620 RepID=UPI0013297B44|nr:MULTISPECIES: outer membrane lipoprotein carrier protein LolA [unclassified Gilliamella]MWN31383.1 outer membrane lipoprotein carrier protein LolA [Gilliamella sp. Pra-s60]MWP29009.1 outer membrane lipoprotein carrier protein LolA [Gilliamella sp. Pra-s54]
MKKYLCYLVTLFVVCFSTCSQAITLEDLQKQFSQHATVRADFVQNRYINGLPNPLHSTGKMIISQQFGLWWQQQTPFIMTLKMNEQRMEQRIDDQKPQIITAESQPQLFQFNHLLTAIFTADKEMLTNNFDLTLSEHNKQWTLVLTPKLAPLNKIFKQIILDGQQYLQTVTINDMQNDKTVIVFSHHQTAKLTKNEQLLFN